MTVVTLTPRGDLSGPVEARLAPDRLAAGASDLARAEIRVGTRTVELGELFRVRREAREGSAGPELRVEPGTATLHGLGAGMAGGRLVVEGDAGDRLGAGMAGGEIVVRGNCGDHAGVEMSGGVVRVEGDAGDRAGGAFAGGPRGMTGGVVLVTGRAGHETGAAMRRGLIVVGGACGDRAGFHAIAGTVVVFGDVGEAPGLATKRGSVVLHGRATLPGSFRFACEYEPPYMRLLLRHLAIALAFPVPAQILESGCYARWVGDFSEIGKGEILRWQASSGEHRQGPH